LIEPLNSWVMKSSSIMSIDTEELSALDLMGKTASKVNELAVEILDKVGFTGDFKGTWNGYPMETSTLGLSSSVAGHTVAITALDGDIAELDSAKLDIATFDALALTFQTGAPAGTFNTLAELKAYYPLGQTGIFITTIDGYWNYFSGSWRVGGVYQSAVGLSRNMFNSKTVQPDSYITFGAGTVEAAALYSASDWIAVRPDTVYTKNESQQLAFYDADKVYISGITSGDGALIFRTPTNCFFIRISIYTSYLNTTQLELGASTTEYIPYGGYSKVVTHAGIVVAKQNGDFNTITAAVNSCNDAEPVTIRIMEGVYEESINLIGKHITLVGEDKNSCIIKTYTNDYYHPPIDLSSGSHLANLTIIADDHGTPPVGGTGSYAVHHDIAGRGYDINLPLYQGVSRVTNCILISKNHNACGVGISNKQELIWENCEFISYGSRTAFYAHTYQPAGATGQKMLTRGCTMRVIGTGIPITLQDANQYTAGARDTFDSEFTFINNVAWSDTNGQGNALDTWGFDVLGSGCITGYVKLGKGSFGNSVDLLNK